MYDDDKSAAGLKCNNKEQEADSFLFIRQILNASDELKGIWFIFIASVLSSIHCWIIISMSDFMMTVNRAMKNFFVGYVTILLFPVKIIETIAWTIIPAYKSAFESSKKPYAWWMFVFGTATAALYEPFTHHAPSTLITLLTFYAATSVAIQAPRRTIVLILGALYLYISE